MRIVDLLGNMKQADALVTALDDPILDVRLHAAANRINLRKADTQSTALLAACVSESDTVGSGLDWSAAAERLLEQLGKAALPALERRLEKFSAVQELLDEDGKTVERKVKYFGDGERLHALIERIKNG